MTKNRKSLEKYYNLWQETTILYERWARLHGLTYNSLTVLIAVADRRRGTCTQKSICREWALPKQTVNTILKDLKSRACWSLSHLRRTGAARPYSSQKGGGTSAGVPSGA